MTIIEHEHQRNVMRHVFGDQADDVTAWVNEHLARPGGPQGETVTRRNDDNPSPWLPEWMWDACKDTDPQPFPKHLLGTWAADDREVPVRVFIQAGENPLNQVGTITVTDRENHNRQVAEALRALADEFDKPTGN